LTKAHSKFSYLIEADMSVLHIAPKGREPVSFVDLILAWVDAGDYDADGKPEVFFFLSGYDRTDMQSSMILSVRAFLTPGVITKRIGGETFGVQ
jgi:hypothetical protein